MIKYERQKLILNWVNEKQTVTIKELASKFRVTNMTIRRDLEEMSNQKLLLKTFGGAVSVDFHENKTNVFNESKEIHIIEKIEVAKKAAATVQENDVIFIGPGTTNELLAKYLNKKSLQIVTSNIAVFQNIINEKKYPIVLIGGTYDYVSKSTNGKLSEKMMEDLTFDKAYIGINGISNLNLTTINADGGELQSIALRNSSEHYIVADKYKLDTKNLFEFYKLKNTDNLITNDSLNDEQKKLFSKNLNLILV